ncbi:MAG: transposase [Comamonadaceae bacterium]|nr:transposase [Comamonadaceae bacterium]
MARPLRIEFPGAVYHVTSRGDRREPIFVDDVDRRALLDVLGAGLDRFDVSALAWCLMGNHYHFVIQTRLANLSLLMRHINGVFTQRFNQRHHKVGHLFQGRFKAVLVDRDSYLLEVCRYVELNPVRAGLVAEAADWPWSSYAALTGQEPCPPWLDRAAVWGYLLGEEASTGALAQKAGRAYADLVAAGKDVALWPDHLRQQMYLGDEAFVLRMQALASDRAVSDREIPKAQRASPKTLQDWLNTMPSRDEAIVAAHRHSQWSLSDIARALGLSVSRVSRVVARTRGSRASCSDS